ncbi:MAG TPA: tRNA (guanosine(37)-N1)-methyltransferase TrmD [Oculatellaceae cyanobacterium]
MLTFHVVTLFPELITTYVSTSIIGRGIRAERLSVNVINPRDFCSDRYRKVDDSPYGGGAGMVLKPEPFFSAVESIENWQSSPVILTTPQGSPFKQALADEFAMKSNIILLCGHYEGFDERIRTLATHEVSIGDFVLTGGELAALTMIDAIGRLVPGVLGKTMSLAEESFTDGLLEPPQYTKPAEFRGMHVPEILRSGDHKAVTKWRRRESLKRTLKRRPDLLNSVTLSDEEKKLLSEISASDE